MTGCFDKPRKECYKTNMPGAESWGAREHRLRKGRREDTILKQVKKYPKTTFVAGLLAAFELSKLDLF